MKFFKCLFCWKSKNIKPVWDWSLYDQDLNDNFHSVHLVSLSSDRFKSIQLSDFTFLSK